MKLVGALFVIGLVACNDKASGTPSDNSADQGDAKAKLAKRAVDKLSFEIYPQWAMSNPDKACPDGLGEFSKLVDHPDAFLTDPWGTPYKLQCGASMPPGVPKGAIAVSSAGSDKAHDTADDVVSWKKP